MGADIAIDGHDPSIAVGLQGGGQGQRPEAAVGSCLEYVPRLVQQHQRVNEIQYLELGRPPVDGVEEMRALLGDMRVDVGLDAASEDERQLLGEAAVAGRAEAPQLRP